LDEGIGDTFVSVGVKNGAHTSVTSRHIVTTQIRRILTLGCGAEGLSDAGFPAFVYPEPYLTVG
jgi:hypothetical protein